MIVIQRKKCKECKTLNYAKYNKEIALKHLKGEIYLGLYPIKDNERVKLIVSDFMKNRLLKLLIANMQKV